MRKSPLIIGIMLLAFVVPLAWATDTIIWDDIESYWTAGSNTAILDDLGVFYSGSLSLNVTTSGSGAFYHTMGAQDWTSYDYITFWWLGNGSDAEITFVLLNGGWSHTLTGHFYDSSTLKGVWHQYRFDFDSMLNSSLLLSEVGVIEFTALPATNEWHVDLIELHNEIVSTGVTAQMISSDWLTFSALMALSLVCLLLAWKSNVPIINFVFGVVTLGTAAYYLGSNIVFAGWINILAILMASLCMLSGGIRLRET